MLELPPVFQIASPVEKLLGEGLRQNSQAHTSAHATARLSKERQERPLYESVPAETYSLHQREIRDKDQAMCCALA